MRKEVLLAIMVGAFIGSTIAFGIWRANKAFLPAKQVEATQTPNTITDKTSSDQTQTNVAQGSLLVTEPENNAVVATEKVTVKGAYLPNATIVIASTEGQAIVQSDKEGSFSAEISLTGGPNIVHISAYDSEGNESTNTLTIIYSTELEQI